MFLGLHVINVPQQCPDSCQPHHVSEWPAGYFATAAQCAAQHQHHAAQQPCIQLQSNRSEEHHLLQWHLGLL